MTMANIDPSIGGVPGNGNGGGWSDDVKSKLKSILDTDMMSGMFTGQNIPSAIEKFVEPGNLPGELWMRTHLRDVNHLNACVRLNRKAKHFGDKELANMILEHMAGLTSIGGLRIDILLQAVIGQMHQKEQKGLSDRLRKFMGAEEGVKKE